MLFVCFVVFVIVIVIVRIIVIVIVVVIVTVIIFVIIIVIIIIVTIIVRKPGFQASGLYYCFASNVAPSIFQALSVGTSNKSSNSAGFASI